MGCCSKNSARYLNVLNFLMLIMSLVILGYAAYLLATLSDFGEALNEGSIVVPLIFGVFFFFVSAIGVAAVAWRSKIMLLIYLIGASVVTVAVLASGAALVALSGLVADLGNDTVIDAADSFEAELIDFQLAVYQVCCFDTNFATVEPVPCVNEGDFGCINSQDTFDEFAGLDAIDSLCDVLADIDLNGAPIVGPVGDGSCGGDDPAVFVENVSDFIADNILPLGIVNLVLSFLMIFSLIATCVLLWSSKEEYSGKKAKAAADAEPDYAEKADPAGNYGADVVY